MATFVDQITLKAKAGDGGDGVVRWRHLKHKPKAGPSGGNGGNGGNVFARAVLDRNQLAKYTHVKVFKAENGKPGANNSLHGKAGADCIIDVPAGSIITDLTHKRSFKLTTVGEQVLLLKKGAGGLGNEHFKSATNQTPRQATKGKPGEEAELRVVVTLLVDVGLVGLPNAGKSTLLNLLTNAQSRVGAYPFTTLEPHLGDFHGYLLADIPGLIDGAATGKGLGQTFLRHVTRAKMLLHLVSLEQEDPRAAYATVLGELSTFDKTLAQKEEWIILTKKDLVLDPKKDRAQKIFDNFNKRVFVISENDEKSVKNLATALVDCLSAT